MAVRDLTKDKALQAVKALLNIRLRLLGNETVPEVGEIYGRTVACPEYDSVPASYEIHTPRGGNAGGSNFGWIDGHAKYRKLVPAATGATEHDRWCNFSQWRFPLGNTRGGDTNCNEWSAPDDVWDWVNAVCTLK